MIKNKKESLNIVDRIMKFVMKFVTDYHNQILIGIWLYLIDVILFRKGDLSQNMQNGVYLIFTGLSIYLAYLVYHYDWKKGTSKESKKRIIGTCVSVIFLIFVVRLSSIFSVYLIDDLLKIKTLNENYTQILKLALAITFIFAITSFLYRIKSKNKCISMIFKKK